MNDNRFSILKRCSQICLWLNVGLMLVKLYFGHAYASRALFADGVHSLLDVTADLFVLYAISVAKRPEDDRHPYGYTRYETLANIVISIMLIIASYAIIHDAILGFYEPVKAIDLLVGGVATVSILLNELSYRYVSQYARQLKSDLLMSTAVHQRADAATSLIVVFSTMASYYHLPYADLVGAVLIAIMIGYYALPSLIKSTSELLDRGIDEAELLRIRHVISDIPGVVSHHLLRSRLMAEKGLVDVHIVVDSKISVSEGHYIGDSVEAALLALPGIKDVMVHIDAEDDQDLDVELPNRILIERWLKENNYQYERLIVHYLQNTVELEVYLSRDHTSSDIVNKPSWLSGLIFYRICE